MRLRRTMAIVSTRTCGPWSAFRRAAAAQGTLSKLSLPLAIKDRFVGAMNLYSPLEGAFGARNAAAASRFAAHAVVVMANAQAYWDAQQTGDRLRETNGVACGDRTGERHLFMAAQRRPPEDAFDLRCLASQRENVKLRDVARRIVDATSSLDHADRTREQQEDGKDGL